MLQIDKLHNHCNHQCAASNYESHALPASPQPPGLEIELICTATDAEGNELLYKFLHQPSATRSLLLERSNGLAEPKLDRLEAYAFRQRDKWPESAGD